MHAKKIRAALKNGKNQESPHIDLAQQKLWGSIKLVKKIDLSLFFHVKEITLHLNHALPE